MARKYTNLILEMVAEGRISMETALHSALLYMSDDDVKDMMECNLLLEEEDEECLV